MSTQQIIPTFEELRELFRKADLRLEKTERMMEKCPKRPTGDKRRFIGAVAGAVVVGEAADFAAENGIYVIVQSGKAVEIVEPPKGFVAKEW